MRIGLMPGIPWQDAERKAAFTAGAARGLGKAGATLLGEVGAHVVIVDNRAELAAETAGVR